MEQIYRIRNLTKNEGKSLRQAAKETGHDFETVKKYSEKQDFNLELRKKMPRKGKLDPYREIVKTWLIEDLQAPRKQKHTAKRVYDRLKEKYPQFDASDRSVRTLIAQIREELKITEKAYIPLDHPPGEAQVDFGEARFIEKGIIYDGHYVNISFPYSNGGYAQLFKSENQECLLEGLKNIFEHIKGVPNVIWFDNMSTAVKKIKEHGKRELSEVFYRFMMHYGFESNFCNPSSGNEKGSVENKVGYHRRNLFVPIPQFNDIKEYNKTLLKKLDEDMDREHYKGIGKIQALFEEEKKSLKTLPQVPYEVCKYIYAKADKYGKINYNSKKYSTTPQYAGKEVLIKVKAEEIEILNKEYTIIVKHKRLYANQKESMQWLPYLELLSKRPTAIKYSGFMKQLPSTIQEFLQSCSYEDKKEALKMFTKMSVENGMEKAIEAFEKSISYGTIDPQSLWATYRHLTSGRLLEMEVKVPSTIPKLEQYKPDISRYDEFIKVEV